MAIEGNSTHTKKEIPTNASCSGSSPRARSCRLCSRALFLAGHATAETPTKPTQPHVAFVTGCRHAGDTHTHSLFHTGHTDRQAGREAPKRNDFFPERQNTAARRSGFPGEARGIDPSSRAPEIRTGDKGIPRAPRCAIPGESATKDRFQARRGTMRELGLCGTLRGPSMAIMVRLFVGLGAASSGLIFQRERRHRDRRTGALLDRAATTPASQAPSTRHAGQMRRDSSTNRRRRASQLRRRADDRGAPSGINFNSLPPHHFCSLAHSLARSRRTVLARTSANSPE